MSEYEKLREEYRENRRINTLKRRATLPYDSEYLRKKNPEYRALKRYGRVKKAEEMKEAFSSKNSANSEYNLRKNPEYRALKRKEREVKIIDRRHIKEEKNKLEYQAN